MASENILMDAVKRGGNRQELHERIRVLSQEAGANVKDCGLSNNLIDLKLVELEPEVAQLMELPAGTKAIYLYRKRFADDEPIVRVETYLPYEACSFILGHDFNRESLYQVLSKRDDTRVTHVTRICEARAADPEDAAVLGLKRGRPVHYFQTIGYNQSGKLIELSFAHYRGDQSRFRVELFRE